MAKRKQETPGYGLILDAWTPPKNAGDPVGCVATSFTFSPVFFEEECLGRFLRLESDSADDDLAYVIEREEKLAQVVCASALVDQHHCRGVRSLRWDLLPARVPGAILHAKVSLLYWSRLVRIIVASANLTPDAYRRNQEVFGVLDYEEGGEAPLICLTETLAFLRETARCATSGVVSPSPALERLDSFLDRVRRTASSWGVDQDQRRVSVRVWPVFSGPGRPPVLDRLKEIWPAAAPPKWAEVMSPFFDPPEAENRPAAALWDRLRTRGETAVSFFVSGEEIRESEEIFLHAPESLAQAQPANRSGASTLFYRFRPDEQQDRPLHAKGLWLDDDHWVLYMIGSSNFTSAGLGLSSRPNIEANLVYLASWSSRGKSARALAEAFVPGEEVDVNHVKWQPRVEQGEDALAGETSLPDAFASAVYDREPEAGATVTFTFAGTPPGEWSVEDEETDNIVLDEAQWIAGGSPDTVVKPWQSDRPPSGFWVGRTSSEGRAWWPVNVSSAGALPPPEELKDLPLEVLVDILTSARPLYKVLSGYLKRKRGGETETIVVDPHKKVNTSEFLLQRTRRVSWALAGLRTRLERPVATEACLDWRLHGPVGVMALAEALCREARSEEEKGFLIAELALELARVRPEPAPGYLSPKRVRQAIRGLIPELRAMAPVDSISQVGTMRGYVEDVFEEIGQ